MAEIEETINRIKKNPNLGFMITDRHHKIFRTNLTGENASKVCLEGRAFAKFGSDAYKKGGGLGPGPRPDQWARLLAYQDPWVRVHGGP